MFRPPLTCLPLPELGTSPSATFPSPSPRNWHILGTSRNVRMTSSGGRPCPSPSWGQDPALHSPCPHPAIGTFLGPIATYERRVREAGRAPAHTPQLAWGDKTQRYIPLAHTPQLARRWDQSQRTNDGFGRPAVPLPKLGTSPSATFFSDGFRPGSRRRTRCLWAGYHSGLV